MPATFLFYDLETFGSDPRRTRIAQFAAIRTNADLEVVDEPISFFVQPADDLLPSPGATMVTGITPQQARRDGVIEAEAIARIFDEMARPETCLTGPPARSILRWASCCWALLRWASMPAPSRGLMIPPLMPNWAWQPKV